MKQATTIILLLAIAICAVLSACKEAPTVQEDLSTLNPVNVEISKSGTSQSIIYKIDFEKDSAEAIEFTPAPDPHGDVLIARPVVNKP